MQGSCFSPFPPISDEELSTLRRLRIPVRVVVPAVVNTLDHTAPAQVPPAVLALVRGLTRPPAPMAALGAEEGLWEAGVD